MKTSIPSDIESMLMSMSIFSAAINDEIGFLKDNYQFIHTYIDDLKLGEEQQNLLHCAAAANSLEVARWLIEGHYVELDEGDSSGATALHYAAKSGHLRMVDLLLENQDESTDHYRDSSGATALHYAAASGQIDMAELLLINHGSKLGEGDLSGATALHYAAASGQTAMLEYLFNCSNNQDQLDEKENNALFYAIKSGNLGLLQWFLDNRSDDFQHRNRLDRGALGHAGKYGSLPVLQWLLEKTNLDPMDKDSRDRTVVHYAIKANNLEMVDWLLNKATGVNQEEIFPDVFGSGPLEYAAGNENLDMLRYLFKYFEPNEEDQCSTILHYTAVHGNFQMLDWIVKSCPSFNQLVKIIDKNDMTAFLCALEFGHLQIAQVLLQHGADPRHKNEDNENALQLIAKNYPGRLQWMKKQLMNYVINIVKELVKLNYPKAIAQIITSYSEEEITDWLDDNEKRAFFYYLNRQNKNTRVSEDRKAVKPEQKTLMPVVPPANVTKQEATEKPSSPKRLRDQEQRTDKRARLTLFPSQPNNTQEEEPSATVYHTP